MNDLIVKYKSSNDIMEFGNDAMEEIRTISSKVSDLMDSRNDNTSILRTLDSIFDVVDYKELKFMNSVAQGGFGQVIELICRKKDRLYTKYKGISNQFNGIYFTLKEWEVSLKENNAVYEELWHTLNASRNKIEGYIKQAQEDLLLFSEEDEFEVEKRSLMQQKINALNYSFTMSDQLKETIKAMRMTNYGIYRNLIDIYGTTMPTIEIYVNIFRAMKEQNEMIETFKTLDEKRNQLIEFSTKESLSLAKRTVDALGFKKEDFELITRTINDYKKGMKEICNLQEKKNAEILSHINDSQFLIEECV